MLEFNGTNIFSNEYISKDRFITFDKGVVMHPYNIGNLILSDFKKGYIDVFNCIGIDEHSINVCADFAKQKIQKFIYSF